MDAALRFFTVDFIEPIWRRWHQLAGRALPQPLSRFTCGRTSLFLRDVLRHEGHPAEWMSGTPYAGGSNEPVSANGYFTGSQWEGHAWVISGKSIVYIIADQFGCDPIVITSVDDNRYAGSKDLANPDTDENGTPVAIVKVKAVRPFTLADMVLACAAYFEDGWLAWELVDMRPIQSNSCVVAARGIYEVDFPLLRKS